MIELLVALAAGMAIGWGMAAKLGHSQAVRAKELTDRKVSNLIDDLSANEDRLAATNRALIAESKLRKTADAAREGMKKDRDLAASELTKYKRYWSMTHRSWQKSILKRIAAEDK